MHVLPYQAAHMRLTLKIAGWLFVIVGANTLIFADPLTATYDPHLYGAAVPYASFAIFAAMIALGIGLIWAGRSR
jgi:hypothetical protein